MISKQIAVKIICTIEQNVAVFWNVPLEILVIITVQFHYISYINLCGIQVKFKKIHRFEGLQGPQSTLIAYRQFK
jgi:hypothetical protein